MSNEKKSRVKVKKNTAAIVAIVLFYTMYEIASLHYIHGRYSDIIKTSTASICSLGEIKDAMNDIDNSIVKIINSENTSEMITLSDKIEEEIDECREAIEEYEELDVSDEQAERFTQFKQEFDKYNSGLNEILDAVNVKNIDRASDVYSRQLLSLRADAEVTVESLFEDSVDSQKESLDGLKRHRNSNNITMFIIAAVIIFVLIGIDRRRAKMTEDLLESQEKVEKQKGKITTAVFKDVLTETNNRMAFVNRFSKGSENLTAGQAMYFVLFDIDDFSSVNSTYGVASGDMILNSTAAKLKAVFGETSVYRTGSDEFVAVITESGDGDGYNRVSGLVDRARLNLNSAHKIKNGSLIVSYSAAVVKKNGPGAVDLSVFGPLKESMKEGRLAQPGGVMFTEL